ncbi:MAG: radical SAM protein [Clostridia bacterium]|nr:radical SAM protein [Clostridia bacterium]
MKDKNKRHRNIPVFIPHLGCPHDCIFCNQRTISGSKKFDRSSVVTVIESVLETISPDDETEIAFFGGSFTGIDRGDMIYLLDTAQKYVDDGRVESIRLSTRPDYIDDEILDILSRYSVKTIELGIQSLSDEVLRVCERGHSAECAINACKMIKKAGFTLIGQMMVGLPSSNLEDERATAEAICRIGADGARIYPTVVLNSTALYKMASEGKYIPLSDEEAVNRTADLIEIFDRHGVPVIRIGLCASEELCDSVGAGEFNEAIGDMAQSEVFYRRLCRELDIIKDDISGKYITVFCPKGCTSKVSGHSKCNKNRIISKYRIKNVKIIENDTISGYNIKIVYNKIR